ncbi:MAG: bacterial Ig-like domain-containing protein [Christensenellaceae bacterium]|nr:bacterial Ig-like domain-containing protein [Christensenellaceae bacterium]
MKNNYLIVVILLLLLFVTLTSCTSKTPIRLEVSDGSFKEQYNLDDELDLTDAKLRAWYSKTKSEEVSINRAMVSGFDSHTPGVGKILVVSYKGAQLNIEYDILSDSDVDTPFRIVASGATNNTLSISTKNTERIENGVCGVSLTLSLTGLVFNGITNYDTENFNLTYIETATTIKIVFYTKGDYIITSSGELFKINFSKDSNSSIYRVGITDIVMSDGYRDYNEIPAVTFTY